MINSEEAFEDHINEAKKLYTDEKDIDTLNDWKRLYQDFRAEDDWLEHPMTKKLKEIILLAVKRINETLALREDLQDKDRSLLYAERRVHRLMLEKLSRNPKADIEAILQNIEDLKNKDGWSVTRNE